MAFVRGSRVKITGVVARPELNDQSARVLGESTGSNGMPRYSIQLESSGAQVSLAPKNLIPIASPEDGGGGGGGFGGMPGMGGIPDMASFLEQVPPWLREKLQRGESPSLQDLKRLAGMEVSNVALGSLALVFVVLVWKVGFFRAIIAAGFLGWLLAVAGPAYGRAGGGLTGIRGASQAAVGRVRGLVLSKAGYDLSEMQAGLVLGAAVVGVAAVTLQPMFSSGRVGYSAGPAAGPSSFGAPSASSIRDELQNAYDKGYADGQAGAARRRMDYIAPPAVDPRTGSFDFKNYAPPSTGSGGTGGFSFSNMISMGFLAKNLYDLGGGPAFSAGNLVQNFQNLGMLQKGLMAMMVLRIFGMSPI